MGRCHDGAFTCLQYLVSDEPTPSEPFKDALVENYTFTTIPLMSKKQISIDLIDQKGKQNGLYKELTFFLVIIDEMVNLLVIYTKEESARNAAEFLTVKNKFLHCWRFLF